MSRLESFIRRMSAQRDVIDHVRETLPLPATGAILEIGLGNGRTFDHLREKFPGRRIVAFDRAFGAHASSAPSAEDLVLGEIAETAKAYAGTGAALVHADIGTGYEDKDAITLTWLPGIVAQALGPGGIAVSGLPLDHAALEPLPLPATVDSDRYFLYRRRP
ncbi:class I SAM-dependent methyltransferase [Shinella sp.]|uniref:class I SAM-dependent methyltransferase n=1 Tax=Shinella sp. TaxID=1870904 RepID=UPI0029AE2FE5|nr:class I SAM-dependent methyltransferase [Shinella sp.]MDX3975214.1 class I SAM-dependent methyltransferase [Shinella sp.]